MHIAHNTECTFTHNLQQRRNPDISDPMQQIQEVLKQNKENRENGGLLQNTGLKGECECDCVCGITQKMIDLQEAL